MHSKLLRAATLGALLVLSLAAQAVMTDSQASVAVKRALEESQSADAIIQMLRDDGRNLDRATVLAVLTAESGDKVALARAGICAAVDAVEAEQVGNEVLDVVVSWDTADKVRGALAAYGASGCDEDIARRPPPSYAPTNTGLGGGTAVDSDGGRPPGSPSS